MSVELDTHQLDTLVQRLSVLADPPIASLLEAIGADLESGTRKRLSVTKTDPSGAPWAPWSPAYAEGRPQKGGILDLNGALIDTIAYELEADGLSVGSPLVYAMTHQDGDLGRGIPQRAFLGISDEDEEAIGDTVAGWLSRLMEAA